MSSIEVLAMAMVSVETLALVALGLRLRSHHRQAEQNRRLLLDVLAGLPEGATAYDLRTDGTGVSVIVGTSAGSINGASAKLRPGRGG